MSQLTVVPYSLKGQVAPLKQSYSNKKSSDRLEEMIRFCLSSGFDFKAELKYKLKQHAFSKNVKGLVKQLVKQIEKLSQKGQPSSGTFTLASKDEGYKLIYYLVKFKSQTKKKVEIFLLDLSNQISLKKLIRKSFRKEQIAYRKFIKGFVSLKEINYFKHIGKGFSDYSIEKKLSLSQIELIAMKEVLVNRLKLRNTSELYWVAQRMGYVSKS